MTDLTFDRLTIPNTNSLALGDRLYLIRHSSGLGSAVVHYSLRHNQDLDIRGYQIAGDTITVTTSLLVAVGTVTRVKANCVEITLARVED